MGRVVEYDSDEEVYAAAKAADQELEAEYDSEDQLIIVRSLFVCAIVRPTALVVDQERNWIDSAD